MTRTESINKVAKDLCEVKVKDPAQKQAIFEATLRGLVDAELERFGRELVAGSRKDYARIEEIIERAKAG